MSDGKQEAREQAMELARQFQDRICGNPQDENSNDVWWASVEFPFRLAKVLLAFATRQASQPQEKAQPESRPFGNEEDIRGAIAIAETAAFQRGYRAMAEKAAQVAEQHHPCARHQIAAAIRSLASAEPPQGEAEKEGRT